ncbi:hypothetical protein CANINC_001067 [Pichia inconspicua]|uniref:Uncharacterized protein n=1 Tax=Pichia inconspicua TaxID=52247 RepID=A0A4T0X4Z7_9ASCO|nr:hypothetical protein CANINC_001067 [[Candida] inconspicua]
MAKLVVNKLNELSGLKGTSYFRIFGQIVNYDFNKGTVVMKSLFDGTTCSVVLNIDTMKTAEKLQNGLVIDIYVVRKLENDMSSTFLSELYFEILLYPEVLLQNKEVLQRVAELQDFKNVSTK